MALSFLQNSSLHGFRYFQSRYPRCHRVFWVLIVFTSFLCSWFFVAGLWGRFIQSPTRLTYVSQFVPINTIPFPAITICPLNRAKRSKAIEFLQSLTKLPENVTVWDVVDSIRQLNGVISPVAVFDEEKLALLQEVIKLNRYTVEEVFNELSITCDEMLVKCVWEGEDVDCREIFTTAYAVLGSCCSFNYKTKRHQKFEPLFTDYYGSQYGLSIVYNSMSNDAIDTFSHSHSVVVIIHGFDEFPAPLANVVIAQQGHETFIAIDADKVTASDDLLSLDVTNRDCVFSSERKLLYFDSYQEVNCQIECLMNNTYNECGCLQFYYPRKLYQRECELFDYLCTRKTLEKSLNTTNSQEGVCDCKFSCNYITYPFTVNSPTLSGMEHSINSLYSGLQDKSYGIIHAYFAKQTSTLSEYNLLTSLTGLIANIGGVYGLFLGFSFVSLFEIAYFIIKGFQRYFRRRSPTVFEYTN